MKKLLLLTSLIFVSVSLFAELGLDGIFNSNMVLQRDMPCNVFGFADKGKTVVLEFAGQKISVKADADGKWLAALKPMEASFEGRSLKVSMGSETVEISNVLVGDVWLLSGQSNMAQAVAGYPLLKEILKDVNEPRIKLTHVGGPARNSPPEDLVKQDSVRRKMSWSDCNGRTLHSFSPLGYFFGKKMLEAQNVPQGLVLAGVSGTRIQPWMPEDTGKFKMTSADYKTPGSFPSHALFNTMIYPLRNMSFKAILWYQGESNALWPDRYAELFPQMIISWRETFKRPNLPFIFALLASYKEGCDGDVTDEAWAWLRDAQIKTMQKVPNTFAVSTIDYGEYEDIHPQNKEPVAERFAKIALKLDGAFKDEVLSPEFENLEISGNTAIVSFKNAKKLVAKDLIINKKRNQPFGEDPEGYKLFAKKIEGFAICGEDGIFYDADAKIQGAKIVLKSDKVKKPIAVRYMWKSFALGNLYGANGLPVLPFRTDNFPMPDFRGRIVGAEFKGKAEKLGEVFIPQENTGESALTKETENGRTLYKTQKHEKLGGRYVYFKAPENFRKLENQKLILSVVYKDSGPESINIVYDSNDKTVRSNTNSAGAWKPLKNIRIDDTKKLRVVEIPVQDAYFGGRLNGNDIRFVWNENLDGEFFGIFVRQAK